MTTPPNDVMANINDRMQVVMGDGDSGAWLGFEPSSDNQLKKMLLPFPSSRIKTWPVSNDVGKVANKNRSLLDKIAI